MTNINITQVQSKRDMLLHAPVYKYRPMPFDRLSYEGFRDLLMDEKFYFSKPESFNDPFDSKVLIDFSGITIDHILDLYRIMKQLPFDLLDKEILEIAYQFFDIGDDKISQEKLEDIVDENFKNYIDDYANENLGLLCLSAKKDDILMWSHYADGHRGYCVELNHEIINDQILKGFWSCVQMIDYSPSYISILDFIHKANDVKYLKNFILSLLSIKHEQWQYEEEYRLVLDFYGNSDHTDKKEKYRHQPLPGIIKNVIFGCKMGDEDKEIVCKLMDGKDIGFYQAVKKKNGFKLEIEKI